MRLAVETPDGPVGAPLRGQISGLKPGGIVSLEAHLVDITGERWTSRASMAADCSGQVHLETAPALQGTYQGVDPQGLFWSARPENADTRLQDMLSGRTEGGLAPALEALWQLEFKLVVRDETLGEMQQTKLVRRRLPEAVRVSPPPPPLCGLLFEPEAPNGAGVLVLGGSEGGLFPGRAALLADHGFTTMALAYFDFPGRPKSAYHLPISLFEDALNWLSERPTIDRVAILGVSRGSEAAQLTAIKRPDLVDALVAWVPSHLIHNGIALASGQDFMTDEQPMWAYDAGSLPGVPFHASDLAENALRRADFGTPGGRRYREVFARAWSQSGSDQYRAPIEKYPGPVLAVAGANDALWPSDLGAARIVEASRRVNRSSDLMVCSSAGHLIGTPGEPRPYPFVMHWSGGYMGIENGFCAYGGTPEGAAMAARDSWVRCVAFLEAHLAN